MKNRGLLVLILFVANSFCASAKFRTLNQVELQLFEEIRDHESQRRAVMQLDPRLCQIAREHCESMNANDYFSHTDPTTGENANDRLRGAGYPVPSWYQVGQNYIESIALNSEADPSKVISSWFGSSGHKRHIFGLPNADGAEFYVNEILIGVAYVKKSDAPQGYYCFVSAHPPTGVQALSWRIAVNFQGLSVQKNSTSITLNSLPPYGVCTIQIMRDDDDGDKKWFFYGCGVADIEGVIELPLSSKRSEFYRVMWSP